MSFETDEGAAFEPLAILAVLEAKAVGGGFTPLPSVLTPKRITALPGLFQCRAVSESHVSELAKAIATGSEMPPLLVIQVGEAAILIDGHHRLEAYRLAGWVHEIPVQFFQGALRDAVLEACAANSKPKLPMSHTERTDTAWRFVLMGGFSKAQIVNVSGTSDGTVARMRRVRNALGDRAFEVASWARANMMANGSNPSDMSDEDREDWLEETAQRHANTMAKAFASSLTSNPEIAARALSIHFGRRLPAVLNELRAYMPAGEEEDY